MGIRLVCSDLDGTLLQYGKKELEGEIFDQIRALHDRGILFCPASGRQYTSLRKLFAPVADCCIFLCENGGVIYKDELCIAKKPMPRALAEEIAEDLWSRSDGQGEVMLSGQNTACLLYTSRPKEDSIIIREYSCPECTKAMNFAKRKNILITSNPGWMPSSPKTV